MAAAPGPFKVLISFGAEDPAGFTMEIPRLLGKGFIPAAVLGPLRRNNGRDRKILEEAGIPIPEGGAFSLRETLADYDLLITHFGVSAFEALYARLPVLLLNPGTFHAGLARRAGLASAGYGRGGLKNLARLFEKYGQDPPELLGNLARRSMEAARRWGLEQDSPGEGLAPLILQADPGVYRACPLCGKGRDPAASPGRTLARFPRRTYRRCFCGMVYMNRLDPPPVEYNMDYFFDGYRRQYGKTYLEDFPRLRQTAEGRIAHIRALLAADTFPSGKTSRIPAARPRLLDIGCAYGPFLAAARDAGFDVTGQDPVQEAVEYVSKNLGLRAFRGFFPGDFPKNTPPFEAITLWYVMEHLREPGKALGVINGLLKTGGVLAFSTPSLGGISRRKSLKKFLEQSPGDHWTLWTPRRCAAMLKPWGFSLRKMVITGNHPERFPLIGRYLEQPGRGYRFFAGVSAFCSLGDTFEAYAVKTGESPGGSHG
jgi:2-polyprenyl-3-methyl-5-hydroxy-6-metoxy-1,4-benzoquinol methylase